MGQTNKKWNENKIVEKEGKQYVQLGTPLPGYTGFGQRVLANNIFGKTYAECLKEAKKDQVNLVHSKKQHFNETIRSDIPFKF